MLKSMKPTTNPQRGPLQEIKQKRQDYQLSEFSSEPIQEKQATKIYQEQYNVQDV